MHEASGDFEVKILPQAAEADMPVPGRMLLDKRFHGPLEAASKGQMLTAMTETQGSAGYVAIEQVRGRLDGREGGFMLQHTGTMDRGTPSLSVTIVPDSGTGALAGISGRMDILIDAAGHHYRLHYTLPDAP